MLQCVVKFSVGHLTVQRRNEVMLLKAVNTVEILQNMVNLLLSMQKILYSTARIENFARYEAVKYRMRVEKIS